MRKFTTRDLTLAALIAAVYAALTMFLPGASFGYAQLRLAEAMTVLPYLFPAAAPGLVVGCLISNLLSPYGLVDIICGTAATAIAAFLTRRVPFKWMAPLPPVLCNGVIVGGMLAWYQAGSFSGSFWSMFALSGTGVALGELCMCYVAGTVLLTVLPKIPALKPLMHGHAAHRVGKNNEVKRMSCSPMRKKYIFDFLGRIIVVILAFLLYFFLPETFSVLDGMNFFRELSPLHLLWCLWMGHMIIQLLPARRTTALGSQKFLPKYYVAGDKPNQDAFRAFFRRVNQGALKVFVVWLALTAALGALYLLDIIDAKILLLLSVVFYLCDLICVLFWCPFRVFLMKNRCCTTCRIFNWDHLMMFSIMVFIPGFFSLSLFFMSLVVFLVWEITFFCRPERFWERTNKALRCSACTDKLCGNRLQKQKK